MKHLSRWHLNPLSAAILAVVRGVFLGWVPSKSRRISFDAAGHVRRFIIDAPEIALSELGAGKQSWVTLTREGKFTDPRYGEFEISADMLSKMVKNFSANVYGQKIFIDIAHKPNDGAAGEVIKLSHERKRLRALVQWTPLGVDAINNKGYSYMSIEYDENFTDNEFKRQHGTTMLGAGLVVRPALKHLDPVERIQLAESAGDVPTFLHPELEQRLLKNYKDTKMNKEQMLKQLREKLTARGFSLANIEKIIATATKQLEAISDEATIKALAEAYDVTVETLVAQGGNKESVTINLAAPVTPTVAKVEPAKPAEVKALTEADVARLFAEADAKRDAATKKLNEDLNAVRIKLAAKVNTVTSVPEEARAKLLKDVDGVLSAGMNDAQIDSLSGTLVAQLNAVGVASQLSARGYMPAGSVQMLPDESSKKLGEIFRKKLMGTNEFAKGNLKCPEKISPFAAQVLRLFDEINGEKLHHESKALSASGGVHMLAGGQVVISDSNLPVGFQRQTILEALSDLRILDLVSADTDPVATVITQIPYEIRDLAAVQNDGIVFEGQPIHRAGVTQFMDTAYIQPMKLAMMISNEVRHFTRAAQIDWDANARNIASNARLMRELIARRLANELQRSSDMFASALITAEAYDTQVTGANSLIKTVQFPIVRPFQARDMQGINVGSAEAPITMVLNGVTLVEYNGTNEQAVATYYRVINYNLGYVQIVNQLGVAQTPTDTGVNTITYRYSTNLVKVDMDLGALTKGQARDKIIQAVGARKAAMSSQRFVQPNFALMSPSLHDEITNADGFAANLKRDGSDTTGDGDLERVKAIPSFATNQPGINLGDERILIGERGLLSYRVAKPYVMGEPFEVIDGATGRPVGKLQAYGEEYSAIKLPIALRSRMTSVLAYSFTGR